MTASIPLAWLGTYLIHSSLLLGAAWAASRLLRRRRSDAALAIEESLWKGALVGGLLTATLQVALGVAVPATAPPLPVAGATAVTATIGTPAALSTTGPSTASAATPYPLLSSPAALLPGWQRLALGVWLLGGLAGAAWLGGSWVRLRRLLRRRAEIAQGPSRHLLDRLLTDTGATKPVRLTGSGRLPVPVALGVMEREICLPRRAVDSLGPRRQNGLLAHELAHLERRDPAWLLTARTIESLLFVQPLNRLARGRLQQIAELRCDAWAVERTGDRTALARCLTEVADWLTGNTAADGAGWPAPAWSELPGMASGTKGLGLRVRRILEGSPDGDRGGRTTRSWRLALPAALLVAVGFLAPGVTPLLPDPPAAEAAVAPDDGGSTEVDRSQETEEAGQAEQAPATEERAERTDRDAHREVRADGPRELDEQLRVLEERQARIAREVERSLAERQERLERLQEQVTDEITTAGDLRDLTPEERARWEAEVQRLSTEAREVAETVQPYTEELDELRAEVLRLTRETMGRPEDLERLRVEAERLSREVERRSRYVEQRNDAQLQRIEEQADRVAAEVERRVERAEREESERHAGDLRERSERLEVQRRELEERMRVLERRREELEQRFDAERKARERALDSRRRELDARREALEERHRDLLREVEERERRTAEDAKGAEGDTHPDSESGEAQKPPGR